jgi:molybdenum cofactor cytidylyltransferase
LAVSAADEGTAFPVAAIVLAAGASLRMGEPKQLLPLRGRPMVRRVVEAVCQAELAQVVVVVGAHASAVGRSLAGLEVDITLNEAWAEGMASSLRVGLQAVRSELQAAIVILADQPSLSPDLLHLLVGRWRVTGAPIVAPFYRGRRGNPVLFDRVLFADLKQVTGDQGGRVIITKHQDRLERVDVEDPAVVADVDTRQDYEQAREIANSSPEGPVSAD